MRAVRYKDRVNGPHHDLESGHATPAAETGPVFDEGPSAPQDSEAPFSSYGGAEPSSKASA